MTRRAPATPPPSPGADPRLWLGVWARVLVGALMIYSGLHKAAAPVEEFMVVIEGYHVLPSEAHVHLFASLIPWVELLGGSFLLAGLWTRAASAAVGSLSSSFFLALLSTKVRGIELPNCGCFGGGVHIKPWQAMALDAALLAGCAGAWRWGRERLSVDAWAEGS